MIMIVCVCTTNTFGISQRFNVNLPLSAVIAADRPAGGLYSKQLPQKLGPYSILSATTETMIIDEEGIPNTISFDLESIPQQSVIDPSRTRAKASNQSEFREELPGKLSETDLLTITSHGQPLTANGITRANKNVKYEAASDYAECEKKRFGLDHMIYHIVHHWHKGRNTGFLVKCFDYTAADDSIKPSGNEPFHLNSHY